MADHRAPNKGVWITSPKARAWLYGIVLVASPLAVGYGLVDNTQAGLWVALAGAVLNVTTGALALVNTGETK